MGSLLNKTIEGLFRNFDGDGTKFNHLVDVMVQFASFFSTGRLLTIMTCLRGRATLTIGSAVQPLGMRWRTETAVTLVLRLEFRFRASLHELGRPSSSALSEGASDLPAILPTEVSTFG